MRSVTSTTQAPQSLTRCASQRYGQSWPRCGATLPRQRSAWPSPESPSWARRWPWWSRWRCAPNDPGQRLDLAKEEPLGLYLAEQLEGRIRQLVAAGALNDDRHASQLWYGMYFCGFPWPTDLLHTMVAAQLPFMDSMDMKGLSEVLYCMRAFELKPSGEKLQQIAHVVERRATALDATEETYRSLGGIIEAPEQLPLPLSRTCVKALHDHAITTPPHLANGTLRTRIMSGMLFSLQRLGHVCTPYEALASCHLQLGAWRAAPGPIDDFTFMLATLAQALGTAPPDELRAELVKAGGVTP